MMDDTQYGQRNKRGDFTPNGRQDIAPIWHWPPRPKAVLRWLPGFLWPWNTLHVATALVWWFWIVPDQHTLRTLTPGWPLWLLSVNWVACGLFYGFFEWRLYRQRAQGGRFKYLNRFPADHPSDVFWFKSQPLDNFLRTFLISIPIWTVIQVLILWCFANGWVPWVQWDAHPVYLGALLLLAPALHELHFYLIHRAMHQGWFYRTVHAIHHNSVNPSPWASLSMHPVESSLYLGVALWHLVIPSNPVLALFQLHLAGFGAINGHIGFDRMELGSNRAMQSHGYIHYLHHKYFDVNFGGDGLLPLDWWFGTWHDGTRAGDRLMQARYQEKVRRLNAARIAEDRPVSQSDPKK